MAKAKAKRVKHQNSRSEPKASVLPPTIDSFPFMKLPAELRTRVYEYALAETNEYGEHHICIERKPFCVGRVVRSSHYEKEPPEPVPSPGLLRVSRQVYQEAIPVLYSTNSFSFEGTTELSSFLSQVGQARAWLRTIWIVGDDACSDAHDAYTLLAQCTRLSHLFIDCVPEEFYPGRSAEDKARGFYEDARPWFEAVSVAREEKLAALDILALDDEIFSRYEPLLGNPFAPPPKRSVRKKDERLKENFYTELKKLLNGSIDKERDT